LSTTLPELTVANAATSGAALSIGTVGSNVLTSQHTGIGVIIWAKISYNTKIKFTI
jgi:hypothetical protein